MNDLEHSIRDVNSLKMFCEEELGMHFSQNLLELHLQGDTIFYFVFSSLKSRIEEGGLPRRFGHDRHGAEGYKAICQAANLDAYVAKCYAWAHPFMKCPLTRAVLELPLPRRAAMVVHEGLHYTFQERKVEVALACEEAMARYVGYAGALEYFRRHRPDLVQAGQEEIERFAEFATFINAFEERLTANYDLGKGERAEILEEATRGAQRLGIRDEVNNAFFLCHRSGTQWFFPVAEVLREYDIQEFLANPERAFPAILAAAREVARA